MNLDPASYKLRKPYQARRRHCDDIESVLAGENQEGGSGWNSADLDRFIRAGGHIELCEAQERSRRSNPPVYTVGHVLYCLGDTDIQLVSIVVHSDCREKGVGRFILESMKQRLSGPYVLLHGQVDADNLLALRFLRSCGVPNSRCVYLGPQRKEYVHFHLDITEAAFACK